MFFDLGLDLSFHLSFDFEVKLLYLNMDRQMLIRFFSVQYSKLYSGYEKEFGQYWIFDLDYEKEYYA
jgi:hypothetical protein